MVWGREGFRSGLGGGCLGKNQYQLELFSYHGRVYVVSGEKKEKVFISIHGTAQRSI